MTFKFVQDIAKIHQLYHFEVDQINCTAGISLTSFPVNYLILKSRSNLGQDQWPSNMAETFPRCTNWVTVPFWSASDDLWSWYCTKKSKCAHTDRHTDRHSPFLYSPDKASRGTINLLGIWNTVYSVCAGQNSNKSWYWYYSYSV